MCERECVSICLGVSVYAGECESVCVMGMVNCL